MDLFFPFWVSKRLSVLFLGTSPAACLESSVQNKFPFSMLLCSWLGLWTTSALDTSSPVFYALNPTLQVCRAYTGTWVQWKRINTLTLSFCNAWLSQPVYENIFILFKDFTGILCIPLPTLPFICPCTSSPTIRQKCHQHESNFSKEEEEKKNNLFYRLNFCFNYLSISKERF